MKQLAYLLLGYLVLRRSAAVETSLDRLQLRWPVSVLDEDGAVMPGRGGSVVTQEYRPPTHMGVDIAVPGHYSDANAVVLAVADGKVVHASKGARGWGVLLDHGDFASGYLHLADVDTSVGTTVKAGQRLGRMGADPLDAARIVHLHLQLAPAGTTTDPEPYLRKAV